MHRIDLGDFEALWLEKAYREYRYVPSMTFGQWAVDALVRRVIDGRQFLELIKRRIAVASRHEGGQLRLITKLVWEGWRSGDVNELISELCRQGNADRAVRLLFGRGGERLPEKTWPNEVKLSFLFLRTDPLSVQALAADHFWGTLEEASREKYVALELYAGEYLHLPLKKWEAVTSLF